MRLAQRLPAAFLVRNGNISAVFKVDFFFFFGTEFVLPHFVRTIISTQNVLLIKCISFQVKTS